MKKIYDCAIVGGGPAGLNAALVLGRARREVALIDSGQPRNAVTHASHGFITRDGVEPAEFRRIGYSEVLGYPSVEHWPAKVDDIRRTEDGFLLLTSTGESIHARKLLLAAGLREVLPDIAGVREFYGKSLFNCPFCDGWELRDQPLVVVSEQPTLFHKVKLLMNWSRDLLLCTQGQDSALNAEQRQLLAAKGIRVIDTPISRFSGHEGQLERVHFKDGSSIERTGGFVEPSFIAGADFSEALGYQVTELGGIEVDAMGRSTSTGVYAAGDSAYVMPAQLILAAASGSKAAMGVMADLIMEDWK